MRVTPRVQKLLPPQWLFPVRVTALLAARPDAYQPGDPPDDYGEMGLAQVEREAGGG